MKVIECNQYGNDWWKVRRGIPTASQAHRIMTPKTRKLAAAHEDYINELIADRINFTPPIETDRRLSKDVANGIDMEPESRAFYALEGNVDVRQVGFCLSDCGRYGCSPDGLIESDPPGGLELKNPSLRVHVGYLRDGVLPDEHRCQVHFSLLVTGRAWWDYLSYAPGVVPLLIRVVPDDFTAKLGEVLEEFLDRYDAAWADFQLRFRTACRRAG